MKIQELKSSSPYIIRGFQDKEQFTGFPLWIKYLIQSKKIPN